MDREEAARTALLLIDLQNDFLHPEGAYARAGLRSAEATALPGRLAPLARALQRAGGWVIATLFTLVPGRDGRPLIAPHLARLRPFLGPGDFAPGSFGQKLVVELEPADFLVEKVAYSAFYQSRLDWILHRLGIERLIVGGIVTQGGVASTLRDAQLREFELLLLEDGCASFDPEAHRAALRSLAAIARLVRTGELVEPLVGGP